ncbi:amino acid aminotransferase [Candidatus Providencia siddallii]|uniref:Aminotransferase n=1 Tax=Candidatus Providencia siddallii TaxID=1715285 RepID=A0ABP1CG01_9GAMM
MFEKIIFIKEDPILGVLDDFNSDLRINKINLGIGIYKDNNGKTLILNSVKKAETFLLRDKDNKNYLSIEGIKEFNRITQELLFGFNHEIIISNRACTVQTVGGTGALRIAADFIAKQTKVNFVWISNPGWPNHKNIFKSSGFKVMTYNYYDDVNHNINFDCMLNDLSHAIDGDVVVLHGCCHNPTGVDLNFDQWVRLSEFCSKKNILPVFDFAYQGFYKSLDEDVNGLRIFVKNNPEIIIASSFSKNFGLYNDRVGACTFVTKDNDIANNVLSHIKSIVRSHYSTPPAHGAAIVTTILNNKLLREDWINELTIMRNRIKFIRNKLVEILEKKDVKVDFSFIKKQYGMFSLSGLTNLQIKCLRDKFGIYMINSGRINVAGITLKNIEYLCNSLVSVL